MNGIKLKAIKGSVMYEEGIDFSKFESQKSSNVKKKEERII